jgi:DnaJ-class molecular chaperone
MDPRVQVLMALERMDSASYYELLAVGFGVAREQLQQAFHRFALVYHPDRHVGHDEELREAAKRVFARGVEAYTVLRDQELARYYDQRLTAGQLRLTAQDYDQLAHRKPSDAPAPAPAPARSVAHEHSVTGFIEQMRTEAGRDIARRVDGLVAQRRYRQAYQQLGLLETVEPDNEAVRKRAEKVAAYLKRFGDRVG